MYDRAFDGGRTFREFLADVTANPELWQAVTSRVRVSADAIEDVRAVPGRWRVLALAEDWCGDAVNILPVVAGLVDAAPNVDLRIVERDEYPGLMERHLTNGSRSIPVFILLDESGAPRGWWGPRPEALQAWFEAEGRQLPKVERYLELRRWYARDRGAAIVREVTDLIRCGAVLYGEVYQGTRPCPSLRIAA
jgi:hypothetical protein